MYVLIAQGPSGRCLLDFAHWFAGTFGAGQLSERESSNYPEGWYFRTSYKDMPVQLEVTDESTPGFRFLLSFKPDVDSEVATARAHRVAEALAQHGYSSFVPEAWDHGEPAGHGVAYGVP